MSKQTSKTSVWIVWSPGGDLDDIHTLCYGDGSSRVYERDNYDARVDMGRDGSKLPCFRSLHEVGAFVSAFPNKQCQVGVRTKLFDD